MKNIMRLTCQMFDPFWLTINKQHTVYDIDDNQSSL